MRILVVSDQVVDHLYVADVQKKYPEVGLLIGCGDLPFYYLEFLISSFNVPLVYVRGNHDNGLQYTAEGRVLDHVPGGIDLHGRVVEFKGVLLAGLEGSMRYSAERPFMYTDAEMRREMIPLFPRLLWNKIKYGRYLDVFVTHSPPFGIHDRPDRPHTGFKVFLPFLRLFKPQYMLHGHIHIHRQLDQHITQFEETTIINVYPYYLFDDPFWLMKNGRFG